MQGFYQEFWAFVGLNSEYKLNDYQTILKNNGLDWSEESMKSADVDALDEQAVIALIVGAFRAERFADGVLEKFVK
ncbi:MAG: hypothetical protein GX824_10045, partial [Clostridiales bacterium]|nr:hypothetical protein [Clostridiales bacterium]